MNAEDHEIKFYSIQFGEWCLKFASHVYTPEGDKWLYKLKHYTTYGLYAEYLEYLKTLKEL